MEGDWNGAQGKNQYQYNGKELNNDFGLGWNDYGARFYDPAIARWTTVDPLAEKYNRWSGYNYCIGNPLKFIDPNGKSVSNTIVTSEDGKQQFLIKDNQPDAIAIMSEDNYNAAKKRFDRSRGNMGLSDVIKIRDKANFLYMVDGMRQLERLGNMLEPQNEYFTDKNGKKITGLHPEMQAGFHVNGNKLSVNMKTAVAGSVINCNLMHVPSMHVHTSAYVPEAEYIHTPSGGKTPIHGIGDGPCSDPSPNDWFNAIENRKTSDAYNVEINSNCIHIFKQCSPAFNINYPENSVGEPNPTYHIIIDRKLMNL
jgi:RHS repeat-associated protein